MNPRESSCFSSAASLVLAAAHPSEDPEDAEQ